MGFTELAGICRGHREECSCGGGGKSLDGGKGENIQHQVNPSTQSGDPVHPSRREKAAWEGGGERFRGRNIAWDPNVMEKLE